MALSANQKVVGDAPMATGVMLPIGLADPGYSIVIERAPDSAGAPNVGSKVTLAQMYAPAQFFVDQLPLDGVLRWYRVYATDGTNAGTPSDWVSSIPYILPQRSSVAAGLHGRLSTLYSDDGTLLSRVVQVDAGTSRILARGRQSGQAAHAAAVTFPISFQSAPLVILYGGISYEPRAKYNASGDGTGATAANANPMYDDIIALNVTAAGFTVRARLKQKGAGTPGTTTDALSTTVKHNAGDSTSVALSAAPASNDQYTVHYAVTVRVAGDPNTNAYATMVIAEDTSPDGSTWTERSTKSYTVNKAYGGTSGSTTFSTETMLATVSGLTTGGGAAVRVRIKSIDDTGLGSTQDLTPASVTYSTVSGAADQYCSKTPDSGDVVNWEAIATA